MKTQNTELATALENAKQAIKQTILDGNYVIDGVKEPTGYVRVKVQKDDFVLSMAVNEKGFICYHNCFLDIFGDDTKAFCERIMQEEKEAAKNNLQSQIDALQARLETIIK